MTSTVVNSGMCRCCASEGTFKDVKTAYNWMGVEEIYYNMLQDCFDITLTSVEDSDNGGICEVCITQLRNAANFKKQVLHTEEQFKLRLEGKFFKNSEVKVEVDKESLIDFGRDSDDNDSDNDNVGTEVLFAEGYDEIPIKTETEEKESKPKKRATRASTSKAKKAKTEEGETSSKQNQDMRCQICNREFTKIFNLKRHLHTKHETETVVTRRKLCDGCGKVFQNDDYLAKHLAIGCHMNTRVCVKCDKVFDKKSDMFKHMRAMHWCGSKLSKFHCPLCDEVMTCHEEHDVHLNSEHGVELDYQEMTFDCLEDLKQWKDAIEQKGGICFPKRSSCLGFYYHCFPTKYIASKRIRGKPSTCPARIEFIKQGERLLVSYQSTHLCERDSMRKKDKTRVFCPICEMELDSYEDLNAHLMEHNIDVVVENLSFKHYDGVAGATKKRKRTKEDSNKKKEIETDVINNKVERHKHNPEMKKQWHNLATLLKHSNATPFKDRNDAGYICAYCFKTFPDPAVLRQHTNEEHVREKFTYKSGTGIANFVAFLDIVDLKCTLCNTPKESLRILAEHLVAAHDKKYYLDVSDYFQPFKLTNEQQIYCCLCNEVFHNMKLLMQHMNEHYRNFICTTCGAGFVNSFRLNRHELTHGKKKSSFPCKHCGQVFAAESKKKAHVNTEHKGIVGDSVCQICKARFKNYYQKTRHMSQVHNVEGIKCDLCDRRFNLKSNLTLHMRSVHLKERPYECSVCSMGFFIKSHMLGHYLATHTNERKFKCDVCGKAYATQNSRRKHMRKNHGITKSSMAAQNVAK